MENNNIIKKTLTKKEILEITLFCLKASSTYFKVTISDHPTTNKDDYPLSITTGTMKDMIRYYFFNRLGITLTNITKKPEGFKITGKKLLVQTGEIKEKLLFAEITFVDVLRGDRKSVRLLGKIQPFLYDLGKVHKTAIVRVLESDQFKNLKPGDYKIGFKTYLDFMHFLESIEIKQNQLPIWYQLRLTENK